MKKLFSHFLAVVLLCVISYSAASCMSGNKYVIIRGYAQGGTYSVKLNLRGYDGRIKDSPKVIGERIDSILNAIDTTISGYNKGSMLSRFNAGETVRPNQIFREVFSLSRMFYENTGGALDVSCAPLFDAWGFGFTTDSMPSPAKINFVLSTTGMNRLKSNLNDAIAPDGTLNPRDLLVDPSEQALPKLNFNCLAQGYTCDKISDYLHAIGAKDFLVDIGEICCDGFNPKGISWTVGVDRPLDGNNSPGSDLDGIWQSDGYPLSIVTSGNYRKFYIKDNKKFAHIIDPRSGYPVQHNLLSATIVATDATTADAYSTYCMVIGLKEAEYFIEINEGIEGYLIYEENGTMKEWASDGFNLITK